MLKENNIVIVDNAVVTFTDSLWNNFIDTGRSTGTYKTIILGDTVAYRSHLLIPVTNSGSEYIGAAVACMKARHLRMMGYDLKNIEKKDHKTINMKYPPTYIIIGNKAAKVMPECNKGTPGNRHVARRYEDIVISDKEYSLTNTSFIGLELYSS